MSVLQTVTRHQAMNGAHRRELDASVHAATANDIEQAHGRFDDRVERTGAEIVKERDFVSIREVTNAVVLSSFSYSIGVVKYFPRVLNIALAVRRRCIDIDGLT
jgi:hypothetical protein